ncbi:hypothetical protein ACVH9Z_21705 [Rhodococcus opacus]|nr:hypothetical protein [Rhodococcus opacus]MDJ0420387.1 hypothetical protein [Rhodococcus opacus]MDV7088143.1 hypothetical protein [Rhodococcus opacus]
MANARAEELARMTALDTGDALHTQARPEIATLANLFRYFAGVAGEIKSKSCPPVTTSSSARGRRS